MRNNDISFFFLSQLILPPVVLALPFLVLYKELALLDTRIGLILVYTLMVLPIVIWIMRDQFNTIPIELEEAALVDGLSIWGAFFRIVLPIALPGMVAAFILSLVLCWNEYFFAALLTSTDAKTLPVMVASQTGSPGHQLVVDGGALDRRDRAAGAHRHRARALHRQGPDRRRRQIARSLGGGCVDFALHISPTARRIARRSVSMHVRLRCGNGKVVCETRWALLLPAALGFI